MTLEAPGARGPQRAQGPQGAQRVQDADPAVVPAPLAEPSRAPLGGAPRQDALPVFSTTPAPRSHRSAPPEDPGSTAPHAAGAAGDHLAAVVTALVLTAFGVLIVSGRVVTEGPVVLVLSRTHGVHLGDLLALAAWAAGVAVPVRRDVRRLRHRVLGAGRARTTPAALRSRRPATSGGARRRRG